MTQLKGNSVIEFAPPKMLQTQLPNCSNPMVSHSRIDQSFILNTQPPAFDCFSWNSTMQNNKVFLDYIAQVVCKWRIDDQTNVISQGVSDTRVAFIFLAQIVKAIEDQVSLLTSHVGSLDQNVVEVVEYIVAMEVKDAKKVVSHAPQQSKPQKL